MKPYGAAPTSQSGGTTTAVSHGTSYGDAFASSPTPSDTSSVISFAMPISTSTPKSAIQQPTSKPESSATSPSMSYPVMSLIRAVSPRTEQPQSKHQGNDDVKKVKVYEYKDQGDPAKGQDKRSGGRSGRIVDFRSEPAVLPVTSSETADQKKGEEKTDKSNATDVNKHKCAAREAFFSSLSSPTTVTTPTTSVTTLTIDSPTEVYSKISAGVNVSPVRGIPSLVRSSAVTMPSSSFSASVAQSHTTSSVMKPSTLPVTGSSVVSSQRFSPASPSNTGQQSITRPKTTFTAIPKPYSPTKSTPSPLTPESPRYRIPPSQQTIIYSQSGSDSSRRTQVSQLKQPKDTSVRPKKVPPPPPPRKSSRVPGHAVLAVNAATVNGQLTKSKQNDSKISHPSISLVTKPKERSDVIKPPKQFSNIELDTKVERKSSIGSLKQFTTPLLESKRDKSLEKDKTIDKDHKPPEMVGKKFSASNLDAGDKSSKQIEKDIDIGGEDQNGNYDSEETSKKVIDGKVTNISAEKSRRETREGSIESTSSSSSLDSQQDVVWMKKKHELVEASSSVSPTVERKYDPSIESSKTVSEDKKKSSSESGKKQKPPPPERRSSLTSKSKTESEPEDRSDDKTDGEDKGSIDRLV